MGGGASINQALTDSLPLDVLVQFVKYEAECEANGFTSSETFKYLLVKHEEYLTLTMKNPDMNKVTEKVSTKRRVQNRPVLKCMTNLSNSEMEKLVMSNHVNELHTTQTAESDGVVMSVRAIRLLDQVFLDPGSESNETDKLASQKTLQFLNQPKYNFTLSKIRNIGKSSRLIKLTRYQVLWERCICRVIHRNLKAALAARVEKMCFIPNNVHLLYSGNKLFFRHNVTLSTDLRIYYHTLSQCVEIVPHITHIAQSPTEMILSSDRDNKPDSAREPETPTHTCFITLPRIYLSYTALLGCVMGTHRRNSGILAEDMPITTEGSSSVYRSRSLEVCLSNVVATFVHSHLKMVRPRRVSKHQPHAGIKRTGSNSGRHVGHSASTDSFRLAGTASTDVNDAASCLSLSMTPEASRSSSPQPSFMVTSPGEIYSPQALYSTPKHHHAGVAAREFSPSPTSTPSPNRTASSRSSASPAASSLRGMAAAALPLSPSSTKGGGSGIAFDGVLSPRVGSTGVALPTVDEVALHAKDYALFFDDTDLLKVVDLSPVCRAPPDELVPILGVAVDQINVFYEPTVTRSV